MTIDTTLFRRATVSDYSDIVALHRKNLFVNLSPSQQIDGFLSIEVNEEQVAAANEDLAVIIAIHDRSVVGFVGGTTKNYNRQFPLLNFMIDLERETLFRGEILSHYNSFIYGPVCVDYHYRGTGILQNLFQILLDEVGSQYEAGTAFISTKNPRSLRAHTDKLGMEILRDFEFDGNSYVMLGFIVPSPPQRA